MTQFLTKSAALALTMGIVVTLWGQTLSHVVL